MYLKRRFDPTRWGSASPKMTHVEVLHTGFAQDQNFDDGMIERGVAEGWVALSGDTLTIKTEGEPLRYLVQQVPGYFCKSTGEAIPMTDRAWLKFRLGNDSTDSRAAALAWLEANGKAADDYEISVSYRCLLDSAQHEKYRAVRDPLSGNLVAAHTLEG